MISLLKKAYRKVFRRMNEFAQRRHIHDIATGLDVLQFWHDHGNQWAREEAAPEDRTKIAAIAAAAAGMSDAQAIAHVVSELQNVWKEGFTSNSDAFGWAEMNDRLPDEALLAFVRGVASA